MIFTFQVSLDEYKWVDNTVTSFTNWENMGNGEGCVQMTSTSGTWSNAVCSDQKPFICKRFQEGRAGAN